MADAQDTTITAPAAPATVAPVVETTTPAATTTPDTASTPAPAVEPAKTETPVITETKPAEVKIENPLGETKTEIKPEVTPEVKKAEEKAVEKPAETKVELPTYEAFKTPDNVKLEGEVLNDFTKILGELETNKYDHKGYQEVGQKLIDFGTKIVENSINRLNDSYVQIHQQAQKTRFEALKADPELGGEKLPDTIASLQKSIAEYGGTETQVAEFRKEITESGLGASPAICRLLHNMQQKINKYTTEGNENRMVPGAKPAPTKVKDYLKFYT